MGSYDPAKVHPVYILRGGIFGLLHRVNSLADSQLGLTVAPLSQFNSLAGSQLRPSVVLMRFTTGQYNRTKLNETDSILVNCVDDYF